MTLSGLVSAVQSLELTLTLFSNLGWEGEKGEREKEGDREREKHRRGLTLRLTCRYAQV